MAAASTETGKPVKEVVRDGESCDLELIQDILSLNSLSHVQVQMSCLELRPSLGILLLLSEAKLKNKTKQTKKPTQLLYSRPEAAVQRGRLGGQQTTVK